MILKRIILGVLIILAWLAAPATHVLAQPTDVPDITGDAQQQDADAFLTDDGSAVEDSAPFWGKNVRKIDFVLPPWMSDKEIRRVTKIKAGKKLTRWRVRQSLRRIYLLGYVENPVLKAQIRTDGQVDVEVKIYPTYVIRDIRVKDNKTFNYSEIVDEILHISMGDDFRESDVPIWKNKLSTALGQEGRLDADVRVHWEKTKRKVDNKVDIFINFDEKRSFRVETISLKGAISPYSRNKILSVLKWRTGMIYKEDKFSKGLVRLKKFLKKNEHLEARVPEWDIRDSQLVKIDKKTNSISINLDLQVGPRVLIEFPERCYSCAQKKWKIPAELGMANQRRFNQWIVKDWEKRIENYFRNRGYYNASVMGTYEETAEEGVPVKRITLTLEKGKKVKIRKIDFKNNPSVKDKELLSLLTSRKNFTEKSFDKDLEKIINHYNRQGFLRAKVLEKRLEYVPDDGLYIQIVLEEGPQTILKTIDFPDTRVFNKEKFEKYLAEMPKGQQLLEGEPLNPFVVESAKARIIAAYMRQGYIKSRVKDKVVISKDGKEATVTFAIKEGRRYKFGNVYIHGNKLTKKHVVQRELFIKPGRPFNYEKIFDSEQALVRLGFFRSVQIAPVDHDIDEEQVDLLVDLEERNAGYIENGIGYNTYFGYSAAFEVGHKNLAGHGRRISFHVDASMQDQHFRFDNRHMAIDFMWPWVARLPMDGKLTIFDNQTQEIGYNLRSFGSIIGVSTVLTKMFYNLRATHANDELQKIWRFWTVGLDYEFARDFIFHIDEEVDADHGEIQITTLSPIVIRDERNNPFHPTRGIKAQVGSINSARLIWASPALQSQVHYLQAIGQTAWYLGLFEIPEAGVFVVAQNFRVGHGQVLRETDVIPISRRFYLGGSTSMRGFAPGQISPLADDGRTPIGGNFFLQSNSELRIPLPANLGLLVFFDAGDVTKDFENFYIDLMRTSTGLGFRYMTPIGPISADYGIKLNKRPYETIGEFYITIGNAF